MGYKKYRNAKGQLHRIDGPAIISGDYYKAWWFEGNLHRVDGPAIIDDDFQTWWINGKEIMKPEDYIHEMIKDCVYGI